MTDSIRPGQGDAMTDLANRLEEEALRIARCMLVAATEIRTTVERLRAIGGDRPGSGCEAALGAIMASAAILDRGIDTAIREALELSGLVNARSRCASAAELASDPLADAMQHADRIAGLTVEMAGPISLLALETTVEVTRALDMHDTAAESAAVVEALAGHVTRSADAIAVPLAELNRHIEAVAAILDPRDAARAAVPTMCSVRLSHAA